MDQRGTGGSNLLTCEVAQQHFVVPKDLSACLEQLASHAELSKYGTLNFVQDIEDLRQALGYRHVHLYGASYGSRVAQLYLREHPDVVRSIVMAAPAPMSLTVPDGLDAGSDETLAQIIKDCHLNAACAAAYPALHAVPTGLDDFTRIGLHLLMYSPETARRIPWLLTQAAAGHPRIVHWEIDETRSMLSDSIAIGLHLTVICNEDLPLARESAGPFAGEYRQACHDWPRSPLPSNLHEPVRSKVPVLMLTGELDPVTGPNRAQELRQYFPNAQIVVVPGGGHMFAGFSGCIDRIIAGFLQGQTPDEACLEKLPKPQYFLGN
jgi:pimeloyl-ACP methyl ester carboxylesterase